MAISEGKVGNVRVGEFRTGHEKGLSFVVVILRITAYQLM